MFKHATLALAALAGGAAAEGSLGGIPTVTIAPNVEMPIQGIGTWLYNTSRAEAGTYKFRMHVCVGRCWRCAVQQRNHPGSAELLCGT